MKVQQVTETKLRGVIITENLSWDSHIKAIRNKVSKAIGIIYKIRKICHVRYLEICLLHKYILT